MYNDIVSDLITRLRNAALSGKVEVSVRGSKNVEAILKVLKNESFIDTYKTADRAIEVTLNPDGGFTHIKRLSRPSLRRFIGYHKIPRPRSGFGTILLSTPKGILTDNQARKQKVGGELICEVW
ncbi:30S ribosomal protein S8 [Candidatus Berkelbacteria bacterium]|nr:30S ribosomal protein S8 [Candidatus Berkelbacteria bacterium]